tara:strand:- start:6476 stop:7267 length:792 start_codon:yes stop_codon:yes gene_type:complete
MELQKKKRIKLDVRKEALTQDRIRRSFERGLTRKFINYFSSVSNGSAKALEENGTLGFDVYLAETRPQVDRILSPHYYEVIKTFTSRVDRYLYTKRSDENYWQELLELFLLRIGANHISDIDNTTRKQLRKVLLKGQKEGLGLPQIAKNIKERYSPKFSRSRSATIARTETHSAASFANHQVGKEYALIQPNLKKRWVATMDDRTRESHFEANGQEVDMEEPFIVGGKQMEYTGDPNGGPANVINCRCVVIYVQPELDVYGEE